MKNIVVIISQSYHLSPMVDIRDIPHQLRNKANFILLISDDLYDQALILFKDFYSEILSVKVLPKKNNIAVEFSKKELTCKVNYIYDKYSNLEFIVPAEYNINQIGPILQKLDLYPWNKRQLIYAEISY